jgi:LL-diaminopimelate aminotransferase
MKAKRLLSLPPYLFEDLDNRRRRAEAAGRDVIDLSIGDPDLPPPASLVEALRRALGRGDHHRYPPQRGATALKEAIQRYLSRRCGVSPASDEILVLVGSKEGLGHLPLAVCDPGEVVLVPDPGYPVYAAASGFAGARVSYFALDAASGFAPKWDEVSPADPVAARLLFLNYPNNPTGATVPADAFRRALEIAREWGTIVVNDAAYADVYFGDAPPLLCAQAGALEAPAVEFFSFSKTFCATGWRAGFAVGRRDVIEALAHFKANVDSGVFGAIQEAIAVTLDSDGDEFARAMRERFERRRDRAVGVLGKLGYECFPACATFYVWAKVPRPFASVEYALYLLERADVLVTPGRGFGEGGEGYFRVALTQSLERIEEALDRIARV